MVFGRFCGLVPIYVLGLGGPVGPSGSLVPVLVALIGMVWGFFIHANLRWRFGPLEWLISTPAFHHWHHTEPAPSTATTPPRCPGSTGSSEPSITYPNSSGSRRNCPTR